MTNKDLVKSVSSLLDAVRKLNDSLRWTNTIPQSISDDIGEAKLYLESAIRLEESISSAVSSALEVEN